jgi:hypothetical protein
MLPLWRRLRLAFTVIFSVIGVGLLALAWALIGRFPGSTAPPADIGAKAPGTIKTVDGRSW